MRPLVTAAVAAAACASAAAAASHPFDPDIITQRVLLPESGRTHGAFALDGSPPMYYVKNATAAASLHKFHIYLEGGGWCQSAQSCAGRAKTLLGSSSSKYHEATLALPSGCRCDGGGYFSSSPARNPLMHDWNQLFVPYIDGGSFAGTAQQDSSWARHDDEDSLSGTKLWYRGRNILDAVLDDLLARRGLEQATDVVLSGCSAGGLAIYLNADHVASKLPSGAKFRAIADSGYFLRAAGNVVGMQWVAKAMNVSTNIACERAEKDPTECIFAQVVSKYLATPTFALQSVVDHDQIGSGKGGRCCSDCSTPASVNAFAQRLHAALETGLFSGALANHHGGFIDSCVHHCGSWAGNASAHVLDVVINGSRAGEAFKQWYEDAAPQGQGRRWEQPVPTGDAPTCGACCHPPAPSDHESARRVRSGGHDVKKSERRIPQ